MPSNARWLTVPHAAASASDYQCPGFDQFPGDFGCQLRCGDDNCTSATNVMHKTGGTHAIYNCCPPYTGCIATLKRGRNDLDALDGDVCERRCAALLDADAFYKLRLTKHQPLCRPMGNIRATRLLKGEKTQRGVALSRGEKAQRGNATGTGGGGGGGSSLALIGDYMRARNVAIDFSKADCNGRKRSFRPGFLTAACTPPNGAGGLPSIPLHLEHLRAILRGASIGAPLPDHCVQLRHSERTDEERRFTVFVSRDDMGNYAHHLGDMLSLFQVFDHLKLAPSEAQVALLDVRIMCWGGTCRPDCHGPFSRLWGAMTDGAPLVRASDWAGRGPMCFREVAFSTHWSEVAKLAWAPPSQCVGSSILRHFRLSVMRSLGILNVFPPSGKLRLIYSSRGKPGMNKKSLTRRILNEPELLQRAAAAYPDCQIVPTDFGSLTLIEQMAAVRRARLLFGMHGAGFINLLWSTRATGRLAPWAAETSSDRTRI